MMKVDQIDANVANEIFRKLDRALDPVCAIMDEAAGCGFQIVWDAIAMQPNGRHAPVNLRLVR